MKIAIIPARGGSKRIPRKNIKSFFGKPVIAWSIEAAIQSHCFDRIIVSTDDEEIAEVARQYGAETPFTRPGELANDFVGTIPVIRHSVEWLEEHSSLPDKVCCIYATAPYIQPQDIVSGLEQLITSRCDYAFSVTSYPSPVQRAFRITEKQRISMFYPENFHKRSQDLEEAYHDAAQFYWGTSDAWRDERPIYGAASVPVILPRHRVQDIDTPDDWKRAELLFRLMQETR